MIDGPRLPPSAGGPPRKLVILAHGYGSNGEDLIGLGHYWRQVLPNAAFVAPDAPEPVPGFFGGYQWFPITRLDPEEMAAGARRAAAALNDLIDAELERHSLSASDCALVGFSQGTMMSLHVGLRRPETLAAIVGFSGALVGPERLAEEIRSRPPVLLAHGDMDDMVPVQALHAASAALADMGVPLRTHVSPGLGHSIANDGLELAGDFLRDAFSGALEGWAAAEPAR